MGLFVVFLELGVVGLCGGRLRFGSLVMTASRVVEISPGQASPKAEPVSLE
jgi:hypothetical protein